MYSYEVSGFAFETRLHFPELRSRGAGSAVASFELVAAPHGSRQGAEWFHECRLPDGAKWLSFGRLDDAYLLRFEDLAEFWVSGSGDCIRCWDIAGTPHQTIRHLLLDQVIPLVLNLRGGEALHAGAVATRHGACAFVGASGAGKSTLVASLAQQGCALLADDCLALEETPEAVWAVPSYQALRLWPDAARALLGAECVVPVVAHYTDKRLVGAGGNGLPGPAPLTRIYLLEPSGATEAVSIAPVSKRHALMKLVEAAFRLDIRDRAMLARQFCFLARLVAQVRVVKLRFPKDFARLSGVRETVLSDRGAGA